MVHTTVRCVRVRRLTTACLPRGLCTETISLLEQETTAFISSDLWTQQLRSEPSWLKNVGRNAAVSLTNETSWGLWTEAAAGWCLTWFHWWRSWWVAQTSRRLHYEHLTPGNVYANFCLLILWILKQCYWGWCYYACHVQKTIQPVAFTSHQSPPTKFIVLFSVKSSPYVWSALDSIIFNCLPATFTFVVGIHAVRTVLILINFKFCI